LHKKVINDFIIFNSQRSTYSAAHIQKLQLKKENHTSSSHATAEKTIHKQISIELTFIPGFKPSYRARKCS
jgi:hypothetical protein